jgi:dTDP-4-dehydrorhamnose reductase
VKPTVLITGASGYVGRATLAAAVGEGYAVTGTYHRHRPSIPGGRWAALDLRDRARVGATIARLRPAAIIHLAAAWSTPEEAQATIVDGTRAVVETAAGIGTRLIHLSSDMIFDGEHAPYQESDPPAPLSFYARAKAAAEELVAGGISNHVIVRTSLVTSFDPPDPRTAWVVKALLAAAESGEALQTSDVTLFADEFRCPVRTGDLAAALVELIEHPHRGVLHIAGPERLSRHQLGLRIASHFRLDPAGIRSGTIAGSGLVRPRDCTLDTSLARSVLRTGLRPLPT